MRARVEVVTLASLLLFAVVSAASAADKPDPLLALKATMQDADLVASTVKLPLLGVDHDDAKGIQVARSTVHDNNLLIIDTPTAVAEALISRYQIQRFAHEAERSSRELAWLLRKAWILEPKNTGLRSLVERCDRASSELSEAVSAYDGDFFIRLMQAQHRLDRCDGTVDGRVPK